VALSFLSEDLKELRDIFDDALYRGSLTLLINSAALAALGFVFWTLAARTYPASTVGVFSGVISGVSLLATVAALGLPNTMIRHVTGTENARELLIVAVTAIVTVGTALCVIAIIALGSHLPLALHLQQRGRMMFLVTALVAVTAVSGTLDAGLIATRSSHIVLIKNLMGSITKVGALFLLVGFRSSGLVMSYGVGLVLATILSSVALWRRLGGKRLELKSFLMLRDYLSFTSGNYLATIMGILPVSVVPLEVLVVRGATETARFAVAFLIVGFLNLIPATVSQVLFAEASRQGVPIGRQLRKAFRGVYGLLVPAVLAIVGAAPLLLRLFGAAYAIAATGCLRVLALSALLTGGTYLIDSMLTARDRTTAYIFMNGANAALVLACVGILLPRGLTPAAEGWALAQGLSLMLGLLVLATGRAGRHHPKINVQSAGMARQYPQPTLQPRSEIYELQIQQLLDAWPMMPTTLIAERIGWDQSIKLLLDRVTELRSPYWHPDQRETGTRFLAGETAQCGLWFAPVEIPAGFGQIRSARQLPVLTMITGYSHWLSAILIPSRHAKDVFAGQWRLLTRLGAVPHMLMWDIDSAIGRWENSRIRLTNECCDFCHALSSKIVIGRSGDPNTRRLIERAHANLERSFLPHRTFTSPSDFNAQLYSWLDKYNTRQRQPPTSAPAELVDADRRAMIPLPDVPPPTEWRLSTRVGRHPFLNFDSNLYSVHPDVMGCIVQLVADLNRVRVLCDGKLAASHDRCWARGGTVSDPTHIAATGA